MKIKALLGSLFISLSVITTGFTMYNYQTLNKANTYVSTTMEDGIFYQKLNDDMRQSQIHFQIQVQEWKNILVRGNDSELYNKYSTAFDERESNTQQGLELVKNSLMTKGNTEIVKDIQKLIDEHKSLGTKYRQALTQFDKQDPETGKRVDTMLRGIDRPTSAAMNKVSQQIKDLSQSKMNAVRADINNNFTASLNYLKLFAALTLLVTLLVCLFIAIKLFKIIGVEPTELNNYFQQLAKGNFKSALTLRKGDKTSVAANAKFMQLKLKNLVVSLKNISDEVDNSVGAVNTGSSKEDIVNALRDTKNKVNGLKETSDKFNI